MDTNIAGVRHDKIVVRTVALLGLAVLLTNSAQEARAAPIDNPNWGYCANGRPDVHGCGGAAGGARSAAQRACGRDYQALCNGVKLGGGRVIACLKQHHNEISVACKNAIR